MKETKYAGTQTEKNLMAAFAGESEARNKYTYFASKAKKEGYEQIAALFLKTADNEKEHAKLWFKELNGIGDTAENLLAAARTDYDFACLPCSTALTGNVSAEERAAAEDDPAQISEKANVIAARAEDYKNNAAYRAKIDALTEVMLSEVVAAYFKNAYRGVIVCNAQPQIDLRCAL